MQPLEHKPKSASRVSDPFAHPSKGVGRRHHADNREAAPEGGEPAQSHDPASKPRDPAPSRTAYRMQRLWLTPLFRAVLRIGVPVVLVAAAAFWYLSNEVRLDNLRNMASETLYSIQHRPEFMVNLMQIDDVSGEVADDIRTVTAIDFPISSFDLDLKTMRQRIEGLDAVAGAELVVRRGGVLDVKVIERVPAVVWRGRDTLELLDGTGHRVASLDNREKRGDLPLIAGDGADTAVPEALLLFKAAGPILGRVRGLLRVGERRWDVILDRNQRIMLPETGAIAALERVLALNESSDLLSRDLTIVDMRDARRPTLRLSPRAVELMRQTKRKQNGDHA